MQIERAFSICNSIARIVQDQVLQGLAIDADYRALVSNTVKSVMGPGNRICNLPALMERILAEV